MAISKPLALNRSVVGGVGMMGAANAAIRTASKTLNRTDTPEALNTGAINNIAETRKKGADQSTIFSNMSSAGIGNMI
jgi:hypothetical protein